MASFVTLEEAKRGLRIDHNDDDAQLDLLIAASSGMVEAYLDVRAGEVINDDGTTAEPRVKLATIMLTGYFYRNPDRDPDKDFDIGQLPKPVSAMLYQLRDPVVR